MQKDLMGILPFDANLERHGLKSLRKSAISTVQVNVGKLCNQTCRHCHVDAGPHRIKENMDWPAMARILELIDVTPSVRTVDLTGGAPELNPHFRRLVAECRCRGLEVLDRCNLTVLNLPQQQDLAQFLAHQEVTVVASLPSCDSTELEHQRGEGVFAESILGLQKLNGLGYGQAENLKLHLVYNPIDASLPAPQQQLEAKFRRVLEQHHGIHFHQLYVVTNVPINRYRAQLVRSGHLHAYMDTLTTHFNPATLDGLMCRQMVSISWDGSLYDCDFNQMVPLPVAGSQTTIWDRDDLAMDDTAVKVGDHCYACTAAAGSSCKGALVKPRNPTH